MSVTNLRNSRNFQNSFWDWTPLNVCFVTARGQETKIRISDVDGEVERNGHFLVIETKRPNEALGIGQQRQLSAKVRRGDTVLLLVGNPNEPEAMWFCRPNSERRELIKPCDMSDIVRYVKGWFLWADANGFVDPFR